mmetsp:Transcript_14143/g.40080  ORF Transcript_14143/g.40080 Transcript_14143/m.40080 type:complete len:619 (+) Transcript_14143:229-2085(+)|eukprot:CAMPEP_0117691418 /NCGR_PEP_ID=MMETSP0804-20121206/25711_1 /TAXON_ID=1074897 /ORGANISM="Tetraselmis astigmatica, Strain CCMP880" /LENGTH=618 /DNA_ID=CAMNT_0005504653 /DNA_START=174 /DNA_END=2030 /DNA_ORIENTATION=-
MAGRGPRGGSWRDIASGAGAGKPLEKPEPLAPAANGKGFSSHLKGSNVSNIDQRLFFTAQVLIGYTVQVTVKGGKVYEGIFHAIEVETEGQLGIMLKMATTIALEGGKALDMKGLAVKPETNLLIRGDDLIWVTAKEVKMASADVGPDAEDMGFGTDSAISKVRGGAGLIGRKLEKWVPDGEEGMSLEDLSLNETSYHGWDQFAVNSKMYGVESSFDEAIYTTTLDKRGSKISEAEASRIAREIERGQMAPTNRHLAEERGLAVDDSGMDEEDKYSSVIRSDPAPPAKTTSRGPSMPAWSMKGAGVAAVQGQIDAGSGAVPEKTNKEAPGGSAAATDEAAKKSPSEADVSENSELPAATTTDTPAAAASAKPDSTADEKAEASKDSDKEGTREKETNKEEEKPAKPAIKSTLNVNAKPFTLNPLAKEFVPSFASTAPTATSTSNRSASSGSASSSMPSSSGGGSQKGVSRGGGGSGGHWGGDQQQQMMAGGWGPGGMGQPGPAGWGGGPGVMQPGMMGGMGGGRQAMMPPGGYMGPPPRFPPPHAMPPGGYYGQPAGYMPHQAYLGQQMMQPGGPNVPLGGPQGSNGGYPGMPGSYGMPMGASGSMGMQPDSQPSADH